MFLVVRPVGDGRYGYQRHFVDWNDGMN